MTVLVIFKTMMYEIILIVFYYFGPPALLESMQLLSLPVGLLQNLVPETPICKRGGECKEKQ